jgi:hypothetical protein
MFLVSRCRQVDWDLLFGQLDEAAISKAFAYYTTWWNSPVGVKALLHAAAAAPIVALSLKLNAWTESAIFFDGSSLGASLVLSSGVLHSPAMRRDKVRLGERVFGMLGCSQEKIDQSAKGDWIRPSAIERAADWSCPLCMPCICRASWLTACSLPIDSQPSRSSPSFSTSRSTSRLSGRSVRCALLPSHARVRQARWRPSPYPPAHPLIGFRKPSPLAVPPALTQATKGSWTVLPPTPPPEVPYTLLEKTDAVRVLAAGNTLIGIVRPLLAHAAAYRVRV